MSRMAAVVFRLDCISKSRTSPSLSTARQSQKRQPSIVTTISFRSRQARRGCRRSDLRADRGPTLATQRPMVW